ncbi:MAG TPA: 2-amino-4-hydroxy-6-hydroxymethyldihydropteridine diphosphokinase, partial [Planctomycetota bacterium]|nr:2-amino-4-hydroxy-6-hydroxymethyldihydropteridine diphosphokinase [Planctomycetota bacterium]
MKAYISLGSNLGDRAEALDQAVQRLRRRPGLRVTALSPVYETEPEGIVDQPKFLNQVVELATELDPDVLLGVLRGIENELGRVRRERWGPRTIDLDLLLYGDRRIESPTLQVPHPRMLERRFV